MFPFLAKINQFFLGGNRMKDNYWNWLVAAEIAVVILIILVIVL